MIASKAKARRGVRVEDSVVKEYLGRFIKLVLARVELLRFRCNS